MIPTLTKSEAQAAYRAGWAARCLATTQDAQVAAERAMDAVQMDCVDEQRPGPEWDAFIDTLPGYRQMWESEADAVVENIKRVLRCK